MQSLLLRDSSVVTYQNKSSTVINFHEGGIILQKLTPSPSPYPCALLELPDSLLDLQAYRTHRLITKSSQLHRTAARAMQMSQTIQPEGKPYEI